MTRALLLTGGRGHPACASVPALRALTADLDIELTVTEDVDHAVAALHEHDLVVVNALRFSMTDARYDDVRGEHAYTLPESAADAIARWHADGGALLGLHTAVISFDSWPGWAAMLGGRWNWTRSFHPPLGPCTVRRDDHEFTITDEAYRDLDLAADIEPVASTVVEGIAQPAAWTRTPSAGGRVAVDLLGHDERSLGDPHHVALLGDLITWLLGAATSVPTGFVKDLRP